MAFSHDIGTENLADRPGHLRTSWTGAALFARYALSSSWGVAVRPEFYWDRNGRMTGAEQFVKAITSTLEYKLTRGSQAALFRIEHRYDESRDPQSGFFVDGYVAPLVPRLMPGQHLLSLSAIFSFDR